MGFGTPGSPHMSVLNSRSGGNLRFYTQGSERFTVAANGNVGVGSANPARTFEVISSGAQAGFFLNTSSTGTAVQALNNNSSGGVCYGVFSSMNSSNGFDFFAGGSVGVRYGQTSSRRWKRNIRPIDSPLDRIEQIRGVWFDWDQDHGGRHDVGMIAEEVGAVLPEIVNYEENGIDAIGMDYSKLTPLLVEAVNALRAEKDAELAALRSENDRLRERLEAVEQSLGQREAARSKGGAP
jgi:hypothetical protein